MINKITNTIKSKYYIYQPGTFLPVYMDGQLHNRREFHIYKAKRAAGHIADYIRLVQHNFKELQQQQ